MKRHPPSYYARQQAITCLVGAIVIGLWLVGWLVYVAVTHA